MMTTTPTPTRPTPSADDALRILSIGANLLPVEIVETRRGRKVRRIVLAALVAFVVLIAGWYAEARYQTWLAAAAVSAAEDDAQRLLRQQRDFAELVTTRAESQAINTQLSTLLGTDLRWSRLLASVRAAAPEGVRVTSVTGILADPSGAAAAQPTETAEKAIGKLTVNGSGASKAVVAAYVDALGKVVGLGNPLLNSATEQEGSLQFTVQLDITTSALGGRYTSKSTNGPGEN